MKNDFILKFVGRNCMVAMMNLSNYGNIETEYYPAKDSSHQYSPHLITRDFAKNIKIWTGPGPALGGSHKDNP